MEKPQSINPVEWAEYNARPRLEGKDHPQPTMVVNRQEFQSARVDHSVIRSLPVMLPRIGVDLILEPAIRRAVNDLGGQGERSDRIALQLLTALAQYAKETGR